MKSLIFLLLFYIFTMTTNAQPFKKDTFKCLDNKELNIYFIKHSSLILEYDKHFIYVDPVSMYADFSQQPKADIILITHEHADHFDVNAIQALKKDGTIIVSNESVRKTIAEGVSLKNGESLTPSSYLHLKAFPAYNTTPEREKYHPKDRDNGYILAIGGLNIYIAGDTEDIPEMSELKQIDIAFLPVNQPYTMTVEQAVNAARIIKPRIMYPYHYGDTNVEDMVRRLEAEAGIEVRIRAMQ